jgi:hypothetical protein
MLERPPNIINYQKLTNGTDEGFFLNIKKRETCHKLLDEVQETMGVYINEHNPIVTELSESAL